MRILFVINGLRYGGMERQLIEIIKILKQSKHSVNLATLNNPGPFSPIISPFLEEDIFYLDRRKIKIISTLKEIKKILKRLEPDIIHVIDNFSASYFLLLSKLLHIPFVNGAIQDAGVSKGWNYYYDKLLFSFSNIVIANSNAGLKYYNISNGHVIYNLIDRKRFKQTSGDLKSIVMNANFSNYKDHMTMLLVGKRLLEEGKINRIGLIGDGKYREQYQGVIKSWELQSEFIFYRHIKNVEEVLGEYGIGILCSTKRFKEGISNSILEYMGTGLIAIGSNVGGTSEIIEDGVNGFLFEAEDPDSLYNKVIYMLNHKNEVNQIRMNAYNSLDRVFSVDKNSKKLLELYTNAKKN